MPSFRGNFPPGFPFSQQGPDPADEIKQAAIRIRAIGSYVLDPADGKLKQMDAPFDELASDLYMIAEKEGADWDELRVQLLCAVLGQPYVPTNREPPQPMQVEVTTTD